MCPPASLISPRKRLWGKIKKQKQNQAKKLCCYILKHRNSYFGLCWKHWNPMGWNLLSQFCHKLHLHLCLPNADSNTSKLLWNNCDAHYKTRAAEQSRWSLPEQSSTVQRVRPHALLSWHGFWQGTLSGLFGKNFCSLCLSIGNLRMGYLKVTLPETSRNT